MKPVMLMVFLLPFLLFFETSPLKCYKCHTVNNTTCEQTIEECSEGEQCITIFEDYTHNKTFPSMLKGCSQGLPCDTMPYSKAKSGASFLMSVECCDEDLCNNQSYKKPEPKEPTGFFCPSCFKPDTVDGCDREGDIQCYDKKDKCYRFSGIVMRPDGKIIIYSVEGCISPLLCRSDLGQLIGAKILNATTFNCTDPIP